MIPKDLRDVQITQPSVSNQKQCCATQFRPPNGADTKKNFQCCATQMYLTSRIQETVQFQFGEGTIPYKLQYQDDIYQRNRYVALDHANGIYTANRANNPDIH
jgi:hypothetical protein